MTQIASKQQQRTLEQRIWGAAEALRGNKVSSECVHVVAEHFLNLGNVGVGTKLIRTLRKFKTRVEFRA